MGDVQHILFKRLLVIFLLGINPTLFGQEISEEILINHVGFPPDGTKTCLIKGNQSTQFKIIDTETGKKVYKGKMEPSNGIIGEYLVGDFSEFTKSGTYNVEIGNRKTAPFTISNEVYNDALYKILKYFSIQRCGPSTTGYHAPCHVDDGRRLDVGVGRPLGAHLDVSGGWHDACDVRKWVGFTIYGMIGLNKVARIMGEKWYRDELLEELQWGNRYFLAMQDKSGFVMNYCGGDDSGYWTDNIIGTEDDRPIHTEPASFIHSMTDRTTQYAFIQAQALTSDLFKTIDPEYSKKCLEAAIKCHEWCYNNFYANQAQELGSALLAYVELYKASGEEKYLDLAIYYADRVMELQTKESVDEITGVRGFFVNSTRDNRPSDHGWQSPQHVIGMCMLVEMFPNHAEAENWKESIRLYSEDYVAKLSYLHTFHVTPRGLYIKDPGGNNKIGEYWVRYLTLTIDGVFANGTNCKMAPSGIGLIYAAKILDNKDLVKIAQKQLDWIVGCNPLNMSSVEKVGYNQGDRMWNKWIEGPPLIPGAVMNGIGGTLDEQPHYVNGSWKHGEYWTIQTIFTMWLMAELQNGKVVTDIQ
jgi:hypothetical protein